MDVAILIGVSFVGVRVCVYLIDDWQNAFCLDVAVISRLEFKGAVKEIDWPHDRLQKIVCCRRVGIGAFVIDEQIAAHPGQTGAYVLERGEDGSRILTIGFRWIDEARDRLLPFGGGVEVLEPYALRASLADYAEQTARLYRKSTCG